jgi:phosphoenolpyruvate carboxykinase (GTP)
MKPFAGYNFGDYWAHWINVGAKLKSPPKIFHVNWFRQDEGGKFLWPGFGDNLRVLCWILDRCAGTAEARETEIGHLPRPTDIDVDGLDIAPGALDELLAVSPELWQGEFEGIGEYLAGFGDRIPDALNQELAASLERVSKA